MKLEITSDQSRFSPEAEEVTTIHQASTLTCEGAPR